MCIDCLVLLGLMCYLMRARQPRVLQALVSMSFVAKLVEVKQLLERLESEDREVFGF